MMAGISQYHRQKRKLLRKIAGLEEDGEIFCMACGRTETARLEREEGLESNEDFAEWHIHHVNGDGGKAESGWDAYYRAREQFEEEDAELMVVSPRCHKQIHLIREDLEDNLREASW